MTTVLGANIYATLTEQDLTVRQAGDEVVAAHPRAALDDDAPDARVVAAWNQLQCGIKSVTFGQAAVGDTHTVIAGMTVAELTIPRPHGQPLRMSVFAARGKAVAAQVAGRSADGQFIDVYCTDPRITKQLDPFVAALHAGGLV